MSMHLLPSLRRATLACALATGLALAPGVSQAALSTFNFSAPLNAPMLIGVWYDDLGSGGGSSLTLQTVSTELAALRSANPVLSGSFSWDTAAPGAHYPWASQYSASLALSVQQNGEAQLVSNPAAKVSLVDNSAYGDTLSIDWETWPNSFNSGILDIGAAVPASSRIDLNTHFTVPAGSLPVHVSYSDLHFARMGLRLDDTSGQALSGTQLPGTLSLAAFTSSSLDLTFVGHVSYELHPEDFASVEAYDTAVEWVQANVAFSYAQVSFTGIPYASLAELEISPVPEPASGVLTLLGLVATLGVVARRRLQAEA